MSTDLKALREKLEHLVAKATPGQWFTQEEGDEGHLGLMSFEPDMVHQITRNFVVPESDARLIVLLRKSVPEILDLLREKEQRETPCVWRRILNNQWLAPHTGYETDFVPKFCPGCGHPIQINQPQDAAEEE